jgi:hypothetical protein
MPDRDSHQLRVKNLLAQDSEINDTRLEEFRMQLEQSLEAWEQKSKRTRRRILIALAVYLVGMVTCQFLAILWRDAVPNTAAALMRGLVYFPFLIMGLTAALSGIWLVALYVFKYAPQLNRARYDAQTSMMLELQQQIKQLHESIERRDK